MKREDRKMGRLKTPQRKVRRALSSPVGVAAIIIVAMHGMKTARKPTRITHSLLGYETRRRRMVTPTVRLYSSKEPSAAARVLSVATSFTNLPLWLGVADRALATANAIRSFKPKCGDSLRFPSVLFRDCRKRYRELGRPTSEYPTITRRDASRSGALGRFRGWNSFGMNSMQEEELSITAKEPPMAFCERNGKHSWKLLFRKCRKALKQQEPVTEQPRPKCPWYSRKCRRAIKESLKQQL